MGRSLLIEKIHEDKLREIGQKDDFQLGLILGQQSEGKDFATDFILSPDPVEDVGRHGNESTLKSKKQDLFETKWVAEHGRQVNRMLIGGISVLGIYVHCLPDVASANQAKLSQCLLSLQSRIERNKWLKKIYLHSERYLLHICSATGKLTCRSFDVSNKQATSKPADCKFQSFVGNWHSAFTSIDVHVNVSIPLSPKASETEKSILLACQHEIEEVWNAYCTSDGPNLLTEDQMISNISTTKSKSKGKQEATSQNLKLTLFKLPNSDKAEDVVRQETTYLEVKFFGGIYSRAVLNSKATYGDAIKALKVDLIRSLLTRIELLCEEAEVNNLVQVEEWSLVSPTRVFYPVHKSSLYFSDYSFKDESVDDIVSRFSELLNLTVDKSDLVYFERSPDVSEASMLFHSTDKPIDQQSDVVSELSNSLVEESIKNKTHIYFLFAIIVILIGILIKITLF